MYMANGSHHHHNSMDTIDRVDPRTLEEQSVLQAAYMYFLADADESDVPFIAGLAFDRGIEVITGKAADARADILAAKDGEAIGKALYLGKRAVDYYTGLQRRAVESAARVVPPARREAVVAGLKAHTDRLDAFGKLMSGQLDAVASQRAAAVSAKVVAYRAPDGPWEKEAATIVPKRRHIGTMTLEQVPVDRWEEVSGSPRWWGETNWASSSYFWCDGKRNLVEIRDLVEIEAGRPITNFDLVKYYRFLERNGMVEFVK